MHTVRVEHHIDCTPERHWQLYLDEEFTKQLLTEGLGYSTPEITAVRDDDDELKRDMKVEPALELPPRIQKMMKGKMGYTEKGRFDKKKERFFLEHTTAALGDKLHLSGEFHVEPTGEGKCKRYAIIRVDVRVFGIGSLLEKVIERNIHKGWNSSAAFMNRYLADHQPKD